MKLKVDDKNRYYLLPKFRAKINLFCQAKIQGEVLS